MMSYWKYSIIMCLTLDMEKKGKWRGSRWSTCVVDGELSFLDHHVAWICSLSVQSRTRVSDILDVWPTLPLFLLYNGLYRIFKAGSLDNIIAGLERTDRVCRIIFLNILGSDLEKVFGAMQKPFPKLTHLGLWSALETGNRSQALSIDPVDFVAPVAPDLFLGKSATRLRDLSLLGIPYPGLPKLLLSATHLVNIYLDNIPHSGYFSPNAMVAALITLTSLNTLRLTFQSPRSCPGRASRRLPPSTRSVLPVLTVLTFKGVSEYLEDLVAHIIAPQLNRLYSTFFNDIEFDPPQFLQFISRTPMSRTLEKAHIILNNGVAAVTFLSRTAAYRSISVEILCRGLDWQVSSLEQVSTSCLPCLSTLEALYIYKDPKSQLELKDKVENGLWLELLQPFTAVKDLHLSKEFTSCIAPVLLELVESRTTEVLPSLQNIFLEGLNSSGPVDEGIGQFAAARQVAGHPIAIFPWANSESEKFYY
jgi:hypothetical protein